MHETKTERNDQKTTENYRKKTHKTPPPQTKGNTGLSPRLSETYRDSTETPPRLLSETQRDSARPSEWVSLFLVFFGGGEGPFCQMSVFLASFVIFGQIWLVWV